MRRDGLLLCLATVLTGAASLRFVVHAPPTIRSMRGRHARAAMMGDGGGEESGGLFKCARPRC